MAIGTIKKICQFPRQQNRAVFRVAQNGAIFHASEKEVIPRQNRAPFCVTARQQKRGTIFRVSKTRHIRGTIFRVSKNAASFSASAKTRHHFPRQQSNTISVSLIARFGKQK